MHPALVELFVAFCTLELLLSASPGPAVVLVTSTALSSGARRGIATALGIVAGNALYFGLSGTGLAVLLLASHRMFVAIQWGGAAYLVVRGGCMLFRNTQAARDDDAGTATGSFVRGFVAQVANPKAIVFFIALLPQFVDPHAPLAPQLILLGAASMLIELAVLAVYVWLAGRAREFASTRVRRALTRLGGAVLIGLGVRLALLERPVR